MHTQLAGPPCTNKLMHAHGQFPRSDLVSALHAAPHHTVFGISPSVASHDCLRHLAVHPMLKLYIMYVSHVRAAWQVTRSPNYMQNKKHKCRYKIKIKANKLPLILILQFSWSFNEEPARHDRRLPMTASRRPHLLLAVSHRRLLVRPLAVAVGTQRYHTAGAAS
jgi:hypothetical protein